MKKSFCILTGSYKSKNNVIHFTKEVCDYLEKEQLNKFFDFTIAIVDDGCPENSWEIISSKELINSCKSEHNIQFQGIKLRKNFGQHQALIIGLNELRNFDYYCILDIDLQDNILNLKQMIEMLDGECNGVFTQRIYHNYLTIDNITRKLYYNTLNRILQLSDKMNLSTFCVFDNIAYTNFMLDGIGNRPVIIGLINKIPSPKFIQSKISKREIGKSGYSLKKRFIQGIMSVTHDLENLSNNIMYYSAIILVSSVFFAITFAVLGIFKLFIPGYATNVTFFLIILSTILLIGGINILILNRIYRELFLNKIQFISELTYDNPI